MYWEKCLYVVYMFKCLKVRNNNNKLKFYLVLIIKKDVKYNV